MSRSVRTVGYAGSIMAHRTLEILQLNVHKRREVQQSLLYDGGNQGLHSVGDFGTICEDDRRLSGDGSNGPSQLDEANTNNETNVEGKSDVLRLSTPTFDRGRVLPIPLQFDSFVA